MEDNCKEASPGMIAVMLLDCELNSGSSSWFTFDDYPDDRRTYEDPQFKMAFAKAINEYIAANGVKGVAEDVLRLFKRVKRDQLAELLFSCAFLALDSFFPFDGSSDLSAEEISDIVKNCFEDEDGFDFLTAVKACNCIASELDLLYVSVELNHYEAAGLNRKVIAAAALRLSDNIGERCTYNWIYDKLLSHIASSSLDEAVKVGTVIAERIKTDAMEYLETQLEVVDGVQQTIGLYKAHKENA